MPTPKPPRCSECYQVLSHYGCTGTAKGCREPKVMQAKNGAKKRKNPAYQREAERLTQLRIQRLSEQARPLQAGRVLKPRANNGWLVFPEMESSSLHNVLECPQQGIRQTREHWVPASLSPKDDQSMVEFRRAVRDLCGQLDTSTKSPVDIDRGITDLCRQAPFSQREGWVRWLVLNNAPPWGFYPWSIEVTRLTMPHTDQSMIVQASVSLRPGVSGDDAGNAAEQAMKLLGPARLSHRQGVTDRQRGEAYACFRRFSGKPRHIANTREALAEKGIPLSLGYLRRLHREWKQLQ